MSVISDNDGATQVAGSTAVSEEDLRRNIGKSPVPSCSLDHHANLGSNSHVSAALARIKLAEEEASYELRRLELERRVNRAKREAEISALEAWSLPKCELEPDTIVQGGIFVNMDHPEPGVKRLVGTEQPSIADILYRLDLPKLELPSYNGDPGGYWNFIRQFENQVEGRVADNQTRLSYLSKCCSGRAKRVIEGYAMLPPQEGYLTAKATLAEMFGQPFTVTKALIDELVRGKPISGSADELMEFSVKMQNCQLALAQLNRENELNSLSNMESVLRRLPSDLQKGWVEHASDLCDRNREPSFKDLQLFVKRRARIANSMYSHLLGYNHGTSRAALDHVKTTNPTSSSKFVCGVCGASHHLAECGKFVGMSTPDRWKLVARNKLCFSCLSPGHPAAACRNKVKCAVTGCLNTHHKLLHNDGGEGSHVSVNASSGRQEPHVNRVSLGVVPVRVIGPSGTYVTYALLDSGSDSSLIDADIAKKVGLRGPRSALTVRSVSNVKTLSTERVEFSVESLDRSGSTQVDNAYAVRHLSIGTGGRPSQSELSKWPHLNDVVIDELEDSHVGVLIGCDVPEAHWSIEERVGPKRQPFAKRTILGWTILGPWDRNHKREASVFHVYSEGGVQDLLSKLYDGEFGDCQETTSYSVEDKLAVEQVNRSIRLENGHIEIGLPWRSDKRTLPDNRYVATRRLNCLKGRFMRDPKLWAAYKGVIDRHMECGYIVPVPGHQLASTYLPRWYLPHHAVINPKKPDKIRVVFDCASHYRDVCLNDYLLQGPNITTSLVKVLLRFRRDRVALASDIQEMFLQVAVPEHDRGALRFLWWRNGDPTEEVIELQMAVHPFGATSSPFCASLALRKSADYSGEPIGSAVRETIEQSFYVDDCLTSVGTAAEAAEIIRGLLEVMGAVGFRLTKWASNEPQALKGLPNTEISAKTIDLTMEGTSTERTLGLEWDISEDAFRFPVNLPSRPATRRGILSSASSLYDPLGLVAPMLLPAKMLLQDLCRRRLDWDTEISPDDTRRWREWLSDLEHLKLLNVPRCMKPDAVVTGKAPQLHFFSDASETGYGIACYLRYSTIDGLYQCRLAYGKSRVAPLKSVSVPRLELSAATLSIRAAKMLTDALGMKLERVIFWTDSMTVLYYIANRTARFSTFVANRISMIHDGSSVDQWKYVRSEDNPADYASRGLKFNDPRCEAWFSGPRFLNEQNEFSVETPTQDSPPPSCEFKAKNVFATNAFAGGCLHAFIARYSSWPRLLRATVWLTRFKVYLLVMKGKGGGGTLQLGYIRVNEIRQAIVDLVRLVQRATFGREFEAVSRGLNLKDSCLRKLNPKIREGLMVVGGRLQNSSIRDSIKHPMVLPSRHPMTDLVIRHYHDTEGHTGVQHVLSTVRERFWILKAPSTIKRIIGRCTRCRRLKGPVGTQLMAPLPAARVTPGIYPFECVGLDYFGPLYVKQGRSSVKRYGCLFTCLKCRAVHIEVAHSLSTDSFIMSLRRFISRRGPPREIYSDNGSNFVGAEVELREPLSALSQNSISRYLLSQEVDWFFNPPAASHRGGAWERMVRTVKEVFRSITTEQSMTDEVLVTFMTEAERIVNNRPLVPIYDDLDDVRALTPNDLLLLRPVAEPETSTLANLCSYTRRWRQAKQLADTFWKRWTRAYLPTLQWRSKWCEQKRNFMPGDVVIIASEGLARARWPLGRIKAVHPDKEGVVRKATVVTKRGEILRDVRRLCLLEGADDKNNITDDNVDQENNRPSSYSQQRRPGDHHLSQATYNH